MSKGISSISSILLRDFKQRSGMIMFIFQKECYKFNKENCLNRKLKNRKSCGDHWPIKADFIETWTKKAVIRIKSRGQMLNLLRR